MVVKVSTRRRDLEVEFSGEVSTLIPETVF
jgi:hypothetical protein